jgi:hypothetical protein
MSQPGADGGGVGKSIEADHEVTAPGGRAGLTGGLNGLYGMREHDRLAAE